MDFFGRERELARIEREIKSDGQSAILVYGRRRVGKSELIKQSLSTTNCRSIYY
ncbi:MAG: ATP-binding protein, partial [Collinsella sp.]|nr:ATP-binding protein [Collinsella sp.]